MSSNNNADLYFNNKINFSENEAKVNHMNFKSQDVCFFNSVLHFNCDSPTKIEENKSHVFDGVPTKKLDFFKDVEDSFNRRKNFNSYLFQDK